MKKVLVLISNELYLDKTKAAIHMARTIGEWKYEILLMHINCEPKSLQWFESQGVQLQKVEDIYNNDITLLKFYLFHTRMKKWDQVVFLDVDILIRGSIDPLSEVKGFGAVKGYVLPKMLTRWKTPHSFDFPKNYDLPKEYEDFLKSIEDEPALNGGLYAFSTDIIEPNTFNDLLDLLEKYKPIVRYEEGILGFYFLGKENWLDNTWNFPITAYHDKKHSKVKILHFFGKQKGPWRGPPKYKDQWEKHYYKVNPKGELPNVIIPGFMKCGTTALASAFDNHPEAFVGRRNYIFNDDLECQYFNDNYKLGESWYRSLFLNAGKKKCLVDKSALYLSSNGHIKRMYHLLPEAKMIVLIRNPCTQIPSYYNFRIKRQDDLKLEKNIVEQMEKDYYMRRTISYARFIQNLWSQYPKEQVKIIVSEQMWNNPETFGADIANWLGLSSPLNIGKINSSNYKPKDISGVEHIALQEKQAIYNLLGYEIPEWETS
jgi:lipopolysaccharide biosynthesis glycosyltransferase